MLMELLSVMILLHYINIFMSLCYANIIAFLCNVITLCQCNYTLVNISILQYDVIMLG